MTLEDLVHVSRDPAFACDSNCKIVAWNQAAEKLLGLAEQQAVGKCTHDLIAARDSYGNRFCGCAVGALAAQGDVVRHQFVFVPTASGEWLKVSLCTVAVTSAETRWVLLHFLRPLEWRAPNGGSLPGSEKSEPNGDGHHGEMFAASARDGGNGHVHPGSSRISGSTAPRWRLTSREVDVLRMMMAGKGAKETAKELDVSTATVRNHIRGLLRKLKVHSKLEALALVMRHAPHPVEPSESRSLVVSEAEQ